MISRRAILFQVKTNQEKIEKICQTAMHHFDEKRPLLIKTLDEKASLFIDKMLWNYTPDSFLPHEICLTSSNQIICISHLSTNPNHAKAIFNLTQHPILDSDFSIVYDFDELNPPAKKMNSEEKLKSYRQAQISIASF